MRKHLQIVVTIILSVLWVIGSQMTDNRLFLTCVLLAAILVVGIVWFIFLQLRHRTLTQALLDLDNNSRRKFFEENGVDPDKADSMLQGWKRQEEKQKN